MRYYLLNIQFQMKRSLVLRWNLVWSIAANFLWLLLYKTLWSSIYLNKNEIAGLSLRDLLGYYLLALIITTFTTDRVDREISRSIMNGSIIGELIRPVNLLGSKTSQKIGTNLIGTILLGIPLVIVTRLILPLPVFHDPFSFLPLFLSLGVGFLIQLNINALAGITAFWTKGVEGVTHTKDFVTKIASGALIPLAFLPLTIQKIFVFLPFRYIIDLPIQIYIHGASVLKPKVVYIGLGWLLGLTFLNQFLYQKGIRRLTIYGG